MKYKNMLVRELYSCKYRNRIKRSKKGKGSFKRVKKVKAEREWEGKNKRVKENKIQERSAIFGFESCNFYTHRQALP